MRRVEDYGRVLTRLSSNLGNKQQAAPGYRSKSPNIKQNNISSASKRETANFNFGSK